MDFYDVKSKVKSKEYDNKQPYPKTDKFQKDYIFDENKSVIWNREEVVKRNKEADDIMKSYRDESNRLSSLFDSDMIEVIMSELNISKEKASKIFHYAWEEGHSSGYRDVIYYAEEICDLISDIIK